MGANAKLCTKRPIREREVAFSLLQKFQDSRTAPFLHALGPHISDWRIAVPSQAFEEQEKCYVSIICTYDMYDACI